MSHTLWGGNGENREGDSEARIVGDVDIADLKRRGSRGGPKYAVRRRGDDRKVLAKAF